MKRYFYLMGLLLALIVVGMSVTSCGDDDNEGADGDVFAMVKGYWKMDNNPKDRWGEYEWIPFWEITEKNLFCRNDNGSVGEKYEIEKFDKTTNTLICTYIDLDDGSKGYKWYVKVVTVTKEKLYVQFYEEGDEDDFDSATFTRVN